MPTEPVFGGAEKRSGLLGSKEAMFGLSVLIARVQPCPQHRLETFQVSDPKLMRGMSSWVHSYTYRALRVSPLTDDESVALVLVCDLVEASQQTNPALHREDFALEFSRVTQKTLTG